MKSHLLFNKFRYVLNGKKKLILICQNTRSVLWYVEKVVFVNKNSDLCCDIKKMVFFITEKSDPFFLGFKKMKKIFLRRNFHS